MNRAIFFDKDGVLNPDLGISGNLQSMEPFAEAADTIAYFRSAGYKIIVVTNQPVVARGIIGEAELREYLKKFEAVLTQKNSMARIDKICYCPHHPNANVLSYRKNCDCRKPKPGMIVSAALEFDIDLSKSVMIGDRISDIIAGSLAGCGRTVQIMSGEHESKMIESDLQLDREIEADFKILNIGELRSIIS